MEVDLWINKLKEYANFSLFPYVAFPIYHKILLIEIVS